MIPDDLARAIERDHRAGDALVRGDPAPKKALFSRRADVTLANPVGRPPARGRAEVEATLEDAAARFRDGDPIRFERVAAFAVADLAYLVEVEHTRARRVGSGEVATASLRATTVWRREDGEWRVAHRHADPITAPRPIASLGGGR